MPSFTSDPASSAAEPSTGLGLALERAHYRLLRRAADFRWGGA